MLVSLTSAPLERIWKWEDKTVRITDGLLNCKVERPVLVRGSVGILSQKVKASIIFFTPPPPSLQKKSTGPPGPTTSSTAMTIKWMKGCYSLSWIWSTIMYSTVCKYCIFGWDHNFFCWTCISCFKCPKFIPLIMVGGTGGFKRLFSQLTPLDSLPDCNWEQLESSYWI